MSMAQLYLADKVSGKWVPLVATPDTSNDVVQQALANTPELIPGDQIDPKNPRRWLMVRPGFGDPNAKGKQTLVLLDQSAIPTFVICQEHTGSDDQSHSITYLIELATQATVAWSGEKMRQVAGESAAQEGLSLTDKVVELLGDESAETAFWAAVDENLSRRRMRLIFVADVISSGLWQMLQFLDRTMGDVEVLALEMIQYQAAGQTALLPRLVGRDKAVSNKMGQSAIGETEGSVSPPWEDKVQTKPDMPKEKPELDSAVNGNAGSQPLRQSMLDSEFGNSWNENTFFADLLERSDEEQVLVGRQIFNWAKKNTSRLEWGGSASRGAFGPVYRQGPSECQLFVVTSNGWLELNLLGYQKHPPFIRDERLEHFYEKLNKVEEVDLPAEALKKRALLPLSLFTAPARLAQFLKVFEWAMVNMEAGTGELKPSGKSLTRRKPNVSWPEPHESSELDPTGSGRNSYESSFDALLNRKRVELDDEEHADLN